MKNQEMKIRAARDDELDMIAAIHLAAFDDSEREDIARLVIKMAADPTAQPAYSLVAVHEGKLAGHILFSRVQLQGADRKLKAQILAPLAVLPEYQGQGIGSLLINTGLELLRSAQVELVFVLGDPRYYARFGFEPAEKRGLHAPHPIPVEYADAWMVQSLQGRLSERCLGTVVCADTLQQPQYWL
ncbi:MAG: GNAT family N-acetyltransferase [bacterium]